MYLAQNQIQVEGPRGPVLLAPVWTQEQWEKLSPAQQQFIYNAHTDFAFYFYKCFLPFHSEMEGEKYPPALPWHLREFCADLYAAIPSALLPFNKEDIPENIVALVWPMGHGKSMTTYALCTWLIGINRRISILSASASAETAELTVEAVKRHLEENERHIDVFGRARLPDSTGPWQRRKFTVERPVQRHAPTMFAAGAEGEIEGRRFDIAILDDVTTAKNSQTAHMRETVKRWINQVVWTRLHPQRRIMIVVGTMHHPDDYLAGLKRLAATTPGSVRFKQYPAILRGQWPPAKIDQSKPYSLDNVVFDPELEVLWPEFWSKERLFEDWLNDPAAFALTRQHQVVTNEGALFPQALLELNCRADGAENSFGNAKPVIRAWKTGLPKERNLAIYEAQGVRITQTVLGIDPAASAPRPGTDPDYTAMALWGQTEDGINICLWLDRFRDSDPARARARIAEAIRTLSPDEVIYEAQAMERYFAIDLSREVGFPVKTRALKSLKQEEINALAGYAAAGMLMYAWGDSQSQAMMSVLEEELSEFPHGRHDDTVIASLHAVQILRRRRGVGVTASLISQGKTETVSSEEEEDVDRTRRVGHTYGLADRLRMMTRRRPLEVPRRML